MSNRHASVLARLGNNLQSLIELRAERKFQSEEDQEIIDLAIGHVRSAIFCLYDLGVDRDVNTYVFPKG